MLRVTRRFRRTDLYATAIILCSELKLTLYVFQVEVFKFPLDLTEQVQQIASQRQRQLGVLEEKNRGLLNDLETRAVHETAM